MRWFTEKLKNSKVMPSMLLSFVMVFFIPFILSVLLYHLSISEATQTAVELNHTILSSASNLVDTHLENIENISQEIIYIPKVSSFQYRTKGFVYPETYKMNEVRDSMSSYSLTQSFVADYFIFFNNSKIVMNNSVIYTYGDFFRQYLTMKQVSGEVLAERVLNLHYRAGLYPATDMSLLKQKQGKRYLPYLTLLPNHGNGYLCILIDEDEMMSMFRAIEMDRFGCLYMIDRYGNRLASQAGEECDFLGTTDAIEQYRLAHPEEDYFTVNTEQGRILVNCYTSNIFGMTYVSAQPMSIVTQRVNTQHKVMLICTLLFFVAGIAVCIIQAMRYSTPMLSLMNATGLDKESPKKALLFIEKIVRNLKSDNASLQRITDQHRSLLKASLTSRLLHGSFTSEAEACRLLENVYPDGLPVEDSMCLLLHISSPGGPDDEVSLKLLGTMKVVLKEIYDRFWPDCLFCDLDEETMALVLFNRDREEIEKTYKAVFLACPPSLRENLTAYGSSGGGASLLNISRTYESVRITMMVHQMEHHENSERIVWDENHEGTTVQYFYPSDTRYRLIESITHGNADEVTGIVNDLFRINLENTSLHPVVFRLFVSELLSTVLRCIPLLPLHMTDDELQEPMIQVTEAPIQRQKDMILEYLLFLTSHAEANTECDDEDTIRQVIQYIHDNYHDCNLSLTEIADNFSQNASVLSTNFRIYTKKTMSSYLEDLRINEAQHLLRTTDWTIKRISEAVGYLSSNSFCRAFRRNTGYNASTYRSQNEG